MIFKESTAKNYLQREDILVARHFKWTQTMIFECLSPPLVVDSKNVSYHLRENDQHNAKAKIY